ncbi:MAG: nucleoside deaminase [Pseudobdellovibrionaceae bacterium]
MSPQEKWMARAVSISSENIDKGGGPFGAVIVKDGQIVAEGANQVTYTMDPTAHAEVVAIRMACQKLQTFDLTGCEIFTSCEPCPMCLSAIYWARISKIYFANTKKDAARIQFDDDFIYQEIPKNPSQRKIPMIQMMHEAALKVFETWEQKTDKIPY